MAMGYDYEEWEWVVDLPTQKVRDADLAELDRWLGVLGAYIHSPAAERQVRAKDLARYRFMQAESELRLSVREDFERTSIDNLEMLVESLSGEEPEPAALWLLPLAIVVLERKRKHLPDRFAREDVV